MLLAVGRGVTTDQVISDTRYQIDIAPTIGSLLTFSALYADGTSLFSMDPPLPIQLSSFTARLAGAGRIVLEWETLTELNNYGFEVQKKHGAEDGFLTISGSFVPGHGTTLVPQRYSFVDQSSVQGEHWYRLKQIDLDGTLHFTDPVRIDVMTNVLEADPGAARLQQNHPNPFNPSTTISFSIPRSTFVTLTIFNTLGQQIAALVSGQLQPGNHSVQWSAGNAGPGVYYYRLTADEFTQAKKLVLLR